MSALRRVSVPPLRLSRKPQCRNFLPNPFAVDPSPQLQKISASRVLPYSQESIYTIIADVSSYSSFLPFCKSSTVTRWSAFDRDGKQWPSEASLTVGWSGIEETFLSQIYCVPRRIVESVGGQSETGLAKEDIRHHLEGGKAVARASDEVTAILSHLQSRWTLSPAAHAAAKDGDATDVRLDLSFAFANPLYSAMSSTITPKVAGIMVEAFEKRVAHLLRGKKARKGRPPADIKAAAEG